jgi:predicted PhzF superfamily epimerase YddE/YHI9
LIAEKSSSGIKMDFPAERATEIPAPSLIKAMFGANLVWTGQNRMDFLVEVGDEASVRTFEPDFTSLSALGGRGVILTAKGQATDFVSRFFAPCFGINEDPVTGSAHCCLGPYWAERLGRDELVGYQASSRGGTVRVRTRGDRVDLEGGAVTVLEGRLHC